VLEPFTYISANRGKEIRSKMIAAFNVWLNVPEAQLKTVAKVVSMLHQASLLIDDIEDDSQLRRGAPGQPPLRRPRCPPRLTLPRSRA
jgi:geranylgeranyl diphosphate synthase type 3